MKYIITACSPTAEVVATTCKTVAGFEAFIRSTTPEDVPFFDDADAFCGWKIYECPFDCSPPTRLAFAHWDGTYDVTRFYTPSELVARRIQEAKQEE